jgi:hypothetical protein
MTKLKLFKYKGSNFFFEISKNLLRKHSMHKRCTGGPNSYNKKQKSSAKEKITRRKTNTSTRPTAGKTDRGKEKRKLTSPC